MALGAMEHVTKPGGVSAEEAQRTMVEALSKQLLCVEEKLVVTRFLLFTPCCFALLGMFLVGLPFKALSSGRMAESENAKRIAAVAAYFGSKGASSEVRRVALCLRLICGSPSTQRA